MVMRRKQTHPIIPAGISCNKAPNRKGKPLMKCRVAGYRALKTEMPTRKHKLSTHATAANKAPIEKKKKVFFEMSFPEEMGIAGGCAI